MNAANKYLTGVNLVARHADKDVLQITDLPELRLLYAGYRPQGTHAVMGDSNSSNVHNGPKQWLGYRTFLAQGRRVSVSSPPVFSPCLWRGVIQIRAHSRD